MPLCRPNGQLWEGDVTKVCQSGDAGKGIASYPARTAPVIAEYPRDGRLARS